MALVNGGVCVGRWLPLLADADCPDMSHRALPRWRGTRPLL